MKKQKRQRRAAGFADVQDSFVKGFVSTGLLAAMHGNRDGRRILHAALQGGAALAAASYAADAVSRRSPVGALSAVAAGAAGLCLIETIAGGNDGDSGEAA